jgi:hypothetical protein
MTSQHGGSAYSATISILLCGLRDGGRVPCSAVSNCDPRRGAENCNPRRGGRRGGGGRAEFAASQHRREARGML